MCLAQGPQRSDAGETRTRGPLVSSQALYHWATALPYIFGKYLYFAPLAVQTNNAKIWDCEMQFLIQYMMRNKQYMDKHP